MTTLWLVRHAATAWTGQRYCGISDPPLDEAGQRAAATLASDLAPSMPRGVRIVSSPLVRAAATARAIADAAAIASVEFDDRWREVDMGLAEGLTFDELAALDSVVAHRLLAGETTIDWPGGETATAFDARVSDALEALLALDRSTVVVSHAGPLRVAMARLRGAPVSAIASPGPASVTTVAT